MASDNPLQAIILTLLRERGALSLLEMSNELRDINTAIYQALTELKNAGQVLKIATTDSPFSVYKISCLECDAWSNAGCTLPACRYDRK
jgi:predicted ArsR family transcriptional regulator